ncbi:MAG: DNA-deoxyinosine glycosylase [Mogibacterium sp.]|nr:DNA-deoxyinosine glycosylase [Mogibacterium sp.]
MRTHCEHGFGPCWDAESEILILGSFPSVKSREEGFYYAHPQNRFWKVLAALACEPVPAAVEEKKAFLKAHRIALYDVVESCTIIGSGDSSIEDVRVTDLTRILQGSNVGTRIFVNGGKAAELYRKHQQSKLGIEAVQLPSTSSANARSSLETLIRVWRERIGQIS